MARKNNPFKNPFKKHMKILFYFGHPAQYLFLRATIKNLIENEHDVIILIKTKDVLEELVKADGLAYKNVLRKERGHSKNAVLFSFLKRLFVLLPIILKNKPSLLVSTDATLSVIGRLFRIQRITIVEDDFDVIRNLAKIAYPNTQHIVCPEVCDVGKYDQKKIGYAGYMKLGYLHPKAFSPSREKLEKYEIKTPFVLIRMARLTEHHDFGVQGMSETLLNKIIDLARQHNCNVYISSEARVSKEYKPYSLQISPSDIHHILAHAELLISDSQSMSVEASMLGTPSIRFSSFAGKISVLEELQHKYQLTYGIDPSSSNKLLEKAEQLLSQDKSKISFEQRREAMLKDKIDVSAFMTWFIENYPNSADIMRTNPDYQYRFR